MSEKTIRIITTPTNTQNMNTQQLSLGLRPTNNTQSEEKEDGAPFKIVCKRPFKVEAPAGVISDAGQREITDYAYSHGLPRLNSSIEWVWCTNRGTLPKRIQTYYYKEYGRTLLESQVSQIGNLAKKHTAEAKVFTLDFTDKIDWSDGDFGDAGSCFWGEKSGAVEMIEENGYAIRAWRHQNGPAMNYANLKGYGRAWVIPIQPRCLAVFNGYGENAITFARLLAQKFNCTYKRIGMTNRGMSDGLLWINNGLGYVVGDAPTVNPMRSYDLALDDPSPKCQHCGDHVDEWDDLMVARNERNRRERVCEECGKYCYYCGVVFVGVPMKRFEKSGEDGWLCPACAKHAERGDLRGVR